MGCFSWLDCKSGKQIKIGTGPVYVLIPKEYTFLYGERICEPCYRGYGRFRGIDIYEIIAEINHNHIANESLLKVPKKESFGGLYFYEVEELKKQKKTDEEIKEIENARRQGYYDAAVKRYERSKSRLNDFKRACNEEYMLETYGGEYLRGIGIEMVHCTLPGFSLKYPVKITYDETALYEECGMSESDPDQGL